MKFPALPFLKKEPQEEYFIALLFKPKNIIAILLNNRNSSLNISATKSVPLNLETASTEEMINATDEAISSIELSVDEGYKLEKAIFSVPYSWVDSEGNIRKEKLLQLKKLSVELAIKPMGFIVSIEALIKYIHQKEGVLTSAIFVEETKDRVYLYLVRGGNILEVQEGELTGDIEKVVEHTLKKVEKFETLPSKMVLLYHEDTDSRQQKFLSYPWTKDLPFLHLPQISLLEKGFENEAVVDAIASQINSKVSNETEISGAELIEGDSSAVANEDENFGFVKNKDVADMVETDEKEEVMEEKVEEPVVKVHGQIDGGEKEKFEETENNFRIKNISLFGALLSFPQKVFGFTGALIGIQSRIKMFLVPIFAVVFFVVLMAIYYLLFLKAEVVIFIEGNKIQDEVLVDLSEEEETSFDSEILHIATIEQEVKGKISQETTGVEEVGENAKGEVTVFNKTDKEIVLPKGIVITSSNKLDYIFDSEVKIASTSSFSTDISSSKVKVTAEKFGKEYNLPSGTNFTIEDYNASEAFAKNEVAFSGGTKEEKQIVSSEDIDNIGEKLTDELFEEAVNKARENVEEDEEIISVLLDAKINNADYSAKAGDEASKFELSGSVVYTLGIYKKKEAEKFINDAGGNSIPEGFVISEEDSKIELTDIEKGKNKITGKLSYEVLYKPDVKFNNLIEEIKGKSSAAAEKTIKENKGVSGVSIIFKNKLPLLPSVLPMRSSQIEIVFRTEES